MGTATGYKTVHGIELAPYVKVTARMRRVLKALKDNNAVMFQFDDSDDQQTFAKDMEEILTTVGVAVIWFEHQFVAYHNEKVEVSL